MSKKSRRRNRRLLTALAALGGAAMLAGRGRGTTAANVDSGRDGDSASAKARRAANTISAVTGTRFPGENKRVVVPPKKPKFNAKDLTKMNSANVQRGTVPPPGIFSMGKVRFKKPMDLSIKPKYEGSAEFQRKVLRAKADADRNDMLRAIRSGAPVRQADPISEFDQTQDFGFGVMAKDGGKIVKGEKKAVRPKKKTRIQIQGFGKARR